MGVPISFWSVTQTIVMLSMRRSEPQYGAWGQKSGTEVLLPSLGMQGETQKVSQNGQQEEQEMLL